jgi:hypothetical protein
MPWRHMGDCEVYITIFDLGIRWRWSASHPRRFTSDERAPGTHCTGGWVGPRVGLNAVE